MPRVLTVHDTGPDGPSTYFMEIGVDISVEDARNLIARSGGSDVYAIHSYENGTRLESFVSKKVYDGFQAQLSALPKVRSAAEIRRNIEQKTTQRPAKAVEAPRPWWKIWA